MGYLNAAIDYFTASYVGKMHKLNKHVNIDNRFVVRPPKINMKNNMNQYQKLLLQQENNGHE